VRVASDSLLADVLGSRRCRVNSFHHQAARRVADCLRAVAWSDDGVVEGIEADGRPFVLGVQWHAECLTDQPEHAALFDALVEAALRGRAARGKLKAA
jgi:putative glutamine amidotransferase